MFLLQIDTATVDAVQKIGLPAVLLLAMCWFLYQVWKWVMQKVDEKDEFINATLEKQEDFHDRLLESQRDIVQSQRDINATLSGVACAKK